LKKLGDGPVVIDLPDGIANAARVPADQSEIAAGESGTGGGMPDLRAHVEMVGTQLRTSLEEAVLAISGPSPRPNHLITRAGLDKTLAGRIMQTVRSPDALGAVTRCPAPNGLGIFVRAAQAAGVDARSIERVARAVTSFEELLARFPRGRSGLEAAVSGWMPEAREQGEKTARQSVFKGMAFLFGYQSEATLGLSMLKPSADGNAVDVAMVNGQYGLRRLRQGEPLSISGVRYYAKGATGSLDLNPRTLDGGPMEGTACLLNEFCVPGAPPLDVVKTRDQRLFVLPAGEPEVNSPITLVLGHTQAASWRRYSSPDLKEEWQTILARCPTRVLINDTFIRDDVYQGVEPVVTTHIVGMSPLPARERGPTFPLDEVHLNVESGWVAGGIASIGTGDVPRHAELALEVFRRLGEDPARYRIHRLRMQYPVTGIAATRWFPLRERGE
jgi:hypothetical protein